MLGEYYSPDNNDSSFVELLGVDDNVLLIENELLFTNSKTHSVFKETAVDGREFEVRHIDRYDYIEFVVPAGKQMTSINLVDYDISDGYLDRLEYTLREKMTI